jgi:general secretion pathway protein J
MMKRAAGFTLVELLVAMALLALLSALLVAGLHVSSTAVLRNEAASETLLRSELAFDLIRRQVERAVPLELASSDDSAPIAFLGDETSVVFVAPPGAFLAPGGEEITWLAIERGAAGARIVLRYRPLDRTHDQWPPVLDASGMQSVVLLDGLAQAAFSYFGRAPPGADPQWWQEWRQQTTLPTLIRLAIAGANGSWPDLVVTPRLGRPVNTGLLPTGALCQRGAPYPC